MAQREEEIEMDMEVEERPMTFKLRSEEYKQPKFSPKQKLQRKESKSIPMTLKEVENELK